MFTVEYSGSESQGAQGPWGFAPFGQSCFSTGKWVTARSVHLIRKVSHIRIVEGDQLIVVRTKHSEKNAP